MKNPIRQFKQFLAEMKDQKLCREYLGQDKYGNKYYQYYSPYGLPTKRMIEFVNRKRVLWHQDLVFFRWLRGWEELPPSEQEMQEYYKLEEELKQNRIAWDEREQRMIEEFYKQKYLEEDKWKEAALPKEDFKPDSWKPSSSKKKNT